MRRGAVALALLILTGCSSGSWWQAKALSGADVKQAIALEESQDPKLCIMVEGSGGYAGVNGLVRVIEARGKNVGFEDCLNAMVRAPGTTTLPSSARSAR